MADKDPLKTQRPETAYVDMQGRKAVGSCQWLLENCLSHTVTTGNHIKTFIGGGRGFESIANDLEAAAETIYLVCWGFDPGMALKRTADDPKFQQYPWARGEPYGELLKRKASSGVKVRLLVWYSSRGSAKQNSLVGYVIPDSYLAGDTISHTWDEELALKAVASKHRLGHQAAAKPKPAKPIPAMRQDYCTEWWRAATSGQIPNLEVRCRDGVANRVKASLANEKDPPSAAGGAALNYLDEKELLENWATHHQKPILIDYSYADPKDSSKAAGHKAVGYIMGLNSISDYWDPGDHLFDQPLRETAYDTLESGPSDAIAHGHIGSVSRKPLRDYASRIEGNALRDVYKNFCTAWNKALLLPKLKAKSNAKAMPARGENLSIGLEPVALGIKTPNALKTRLQVVRTQPEEVLSDHTQLWAFDKSIKQTYFQASSMARNYLYLENQYFFYEEWAKHIKTNRMAFMDWVQDAGKKSKDARLLHLLVTIPNPEADGMVPRTYDALKSLGQGDSMPDQEGMVSKHSDDYEWHKSDIVKTALKVKAPTLDQNGVLLQDGKSLGLKVLVTKLVSQNKGPNSKLGKYRDIYIHSKLMLADDEFMTLGSANLNQRSMAADSEINVATDNTWHNTDLRKRVWGQLVQERRHRLAKP